MPEGNDATTWTNQIFNSFSVTNGLITYTNFSATTNNTNFPWFEFTLTPAPEFFFIETDLSIPLDPIIIDYTCPNNTVNRASCEIKGIPFEFNENLGVLTFLSIVGIGKGIEKWKKRKNKDSDSDSAEK